jgi:predicted nuclease of predicted toxin-antitoxin system
MGISASLTNWLNSIGHDAVHLNDEKLFQLPDKLIFQKAIIEKRIILTADMDFGQLLAFNQSGIASVIQFRTSDFKPENIKSKLELLFEKFQDQLDGDFLITIEDNRIRFRKLPI